MVATLAYLLNLFTYLLNKCFVDLMECSKINHKKKKKGQKHRIARVNCVKFCDLFITKSLTSMIYATHVQMHYISFTQILN